MSPATRIALHETTALWCALQRDSVLPWIDVAADVLSVAVQARRFAPAPAPARAMLLAAVTLHARPFALICACEHAGPREWGCAEQTWLKRTAAQVVAALNRLQHAAPEARTAIERPRDGFPMLDTRCDESLLQPVEQRFAPDRLFRTGSET